MRREAEFFDDREMDLIYIAKRLSEAKQLEDALTAAGWDYYVEADDYRGGFLFTSLRKGAFFYVLFPQADEARALLVGWGYKPQPALPRQLDVGGDVD